MTKAWRAAHAYTKAWRIVRRCFMQAMNGIPVGGCLVKCGANFTTLEWRLSGFHSSAGQNWLKAEGSPWV